MAINIKTVTCPACGAKVKYEENNKTVVCEFCGAVLDMTEEYHDKKDRERDDIQDQQIRNIMNKMNGGTSGNTTANNADIKKARKTALIIFLSIFGIFFIGSIVTRIVGGALLYKNISDQVLSEKTEEIEINPFDKLSIEYYGVSGTAYARISDTNVYSISKIKKTTTELEKLSNGHTITVKYDDNTAQQSNTKYILTQTEKTFIVNGLDEYAADITGVGEEDLEALKKNAINKAKAECEEAGCDYADDSFEVYAIYSMIEKDYSEQMSVFVISFDYYNNEEEVKKGYFMAKYSNVVKHANGEYKINFNANVFSYTKESYFGGFTVTSAHSNWDAVYTDVYLNNKSDWFIHEDFIKSE